MIGKRRLDKALADWGRCRRESVFWFSLVRGGWIRYETNAKSQGVGGL